MNREDWTMLVIAAAGGKPLSPVQLQKCLFLLGKTFGDRIGTDYYEFVPYLYGPFDAQVYEDAKALSSKGYVALEPSASGRWIEYAATPAGMERAQTIKTEVDGRIAEYVENLVGWAQRLSFQDLLRAIYQKFPEFKENSVFVG